MAGRLSDIYRVAAFPKPLTRAERKALPKIRASESLTLARKRAIEKLGGVASFLLYTQKREAMRAARRLARGIGVGAVGEVYGGRRLDALAMQVEIDRDPRSGRVRVTIKEL